MIPIYIAEPMRPWHFLGASVIRTPRRRRISKSAFLSTAPLFVLSPLPTLRLEADAPPAPPLETAPHRTAPQIALHLCNCSLRARASAGLVRQPWTAEAAVASPACHRHRPRRTARRRPRRTQLDHTHPHDRQPPRAGSDHRRDLPRPDHCPPIDGYARRNHHTLHRRSASRRQTRPVRGSGHRLRVPAPRGRPRSTSRWPTMFASSILKAAPPDRRTRPSHLQAPRRRQSPGFTSLPRVKVP